MKRIDPKRMNRAIALYVGGKPISEVERITKIGKSTIYRELDRRGVERHQARRDAVEGER